MTPDARSGRISAAFSAAAAPIDCPTSTARDGPPAAATASSTAMMSPGKFRASCSSVHRVLPKPRRSTVMTV